MLNRPLQPQEILWNDMVAALQASPPPYLGQFLDADDFQALADHLRDALARHVDRYINAIGKMCEEHSHTLDTDVFKEPLFEALDGNALWELEQAAQLWREDQEEEELEGAA